MPENIIITDNFKTEINKIKTKKQNYRRLYTLFTITNKLLMIINFSTLLFCILIPNTNIGLILSIYTLSFSVICNASSYIPTLEKLEAIYDDGIIPQIEAFERKVENNPIEISNDDTAVDVIEHIQNIEKENIKDYMGKAFILVNTLRHVDYTKISICGITYLIMFVCIPIIYHYSS